MSEKFNLKEWMHQNGQGPYKLHENYIDLKAIGSLKEEKPEELEDIPTEEEPKTSGRPPHATSIKPWWDTEAKDDMIQENFGIDFKVVGYIGKKPVFTAMEDGLELEVSPNPEGTYSVWVGDMQMDQKFKDAKEAMDYLNSVGDIKSLIKGGLKEEDIPYAEELPEEDMYTFGKNLHNKTQKILNSVGAKIMNNLTVMEVASSLDKYKQILSKLNAFEGELSNGMDKIYDYVESAGDDPKAKELDSMYTELDDDKMLIDDLKEVLDTMIYKIDSFNRGNKKAFSLGNMSV